MPKLAVQNTPLMPGSLDKGQLEGLNRRLESADATQRVAFGLENLPANFMLSSSFGIQSAVMLHLVTRQYPDIPVVLTDTGHLFPETYRFIDELTARLNLNLKVYAAPLSAAWQQARWGKLWEQGPEALARYNQINKVEPMQRAQQELAVKTWFAGLRRSQADTRESLPVLQQLQGQFKLLPIIDWSNKDVHRYLQQHNLPYHPLWEQGYVSVGDWHTSAPMEPGMSEQDTRFFGAQRECGLHDIGTNEQGDGI